MILYEHGPITESKAQVLVRPVNLAGTFNQGLSGEFHKRWPDSTRQYLQLLKGEKLLPGKVRLYRVPKGSPTKFIYLMLVAEQFGQEPNIQWVTDGLRHVRHLALKHSLKSVAIPLIGAEALTVGSEVERKIHAQLGLIEGLEVHIHN